MTAAVVIPHYGDPDLTLTCLRSVQATAPDCEVVIVDNSGNLPPGCPVTVITPPRNLGFAAGCNLGARATTADVVVFLNNDTRVHTGWLDAILAEFTDPTVTVTGAKLVYPDGTIQHTGIAVDLTATPGYEAVNRTDNPDQPADVDAVTGACMAVTRTAHLTFDEGFWNGYEDVDLCLTAHRDGGRVRYTPHAVITHLESQSGPERWTKVHDNIHRLRHKWGNR